MITNVAWVASVQQMSISYEDMSETSVMIHRIIVLRIAVKIKPRPGSFQSLVATCARILATTTLHNSTP